MIPYLPIFAKQFGISATVVGIIQFIAPTIANIAKLLISAVTNYFQNLKQTLMGLVIINTFCCIMVMFIPTAKTNNLLLYSNFSCNSNLWFIPVRIESLACTFHVNETMECRTSCTTCVTYAPASNITEILPEFLVLGNFQSNVTTIICKQNVEKHVMNLMMLENDVIAVLNETKPRCAKNVFYNCTINCPCEHNCCQISNDYTNAKFWMLLVLYLLLSTLAIIMNTLSDAACYEVIGNNLSTYGYQRLWASVGTGSFALLTGYLLDIFTIKQNSDYSVGFYIMISVMFLDFVVLCGVEVDMVLSTVNVFKHLKSLFSSFRHIIFMCFTFYIGVISTLPGTFLFWYLDDLGASKILMGISLAISSVSEIPTHFYSSKIIGKSGHFITMFLSLLCYSIRYFMYSALQDPWYVLPLELLQGLTYSLFIITITSYAKMISLPGTEATIQGFLGCLFSGLGWAIGNILGGCLMDAYGGKYTFHFAAITATLGYCFLLSLHLLLLYFEDKRNKSTIPKLSPIENPAFEREFT